ncbi:hypothetical protein PR048_004427, partial [Dryococelus australis]
MFTTENLGELVHLKFCTPPLRSLYNSPDNVLYAVRGCDITSKIFLFREEYFLPPPPPPFFSQKKRKKEIREFAEEFKNPNAAAPKIPEVGQCILLAFAIPSGHTTRSWRGRELKKKQPLDWSWTRGSRGLQPIKTARDDVPPKLLTTVSCKCAIVGCTGACGCGCSILCEFCCRQSCENRPGVVLEEDEDDTDPIPSTQEEPHDDSAPPTPHPYIN